MTWLLVGAALLLAPPPLPAAAAPAVHRLRHHWRSAHRTDLSIAWVLALAGELRAGSDSARALRTCARRFGVARHAARAAAIGADVPAALHRDAHESPVLVPVAAAWSISLQTGAGLADVLDNIADGYRRTVEVRRALAVELAGPRATAKLMSLLPLIGVGFAMMLGADPIGWFTSSLVGAACLTAGVGLNGVGFWWMHQIVRGVEADL